MKCPRCQHENPAGSSFCLECGARLGLTCGSCGTELPAGSKFCNKCGTPVGGAAIGQPRFPSPESYTPKHLAEKILTSKGALEGERKQVTVLFADMKGSMELLADRDPEEARKILDPILELMMESVHRYEGTVNQVMGDGIMALFGAPLAHEDHAVRACYAALKMQESVKRYAEEVFRSQGLAVETRVGLNSGEVVVRSVGSDLRMDYTAVGQTTHLAARMEQLASPGTILLTSHTLELVRGYVEVKRRGLVPVKGLGEPVEVYEVAGAGPVRRRFEAAALRGLTRFVGREAELEQLRTALELAGKGRGQVVAVVGESGVGKSRLFHEFTHSHRMQGWLSTESGSVSYGKATPYLPVIDLLKAYFQIDSRDDGRKIREKVTGKILALDRALEPMLPPILALLDAPVEDRQWQAFDPPQRRQRTLEAIKHLLIRESQIQPVVVVFEDLHWVDGESQAVLDSLVESLPAARVLLLVNYRTEYEHGWSRKTYYTQLRIDPLPPEGADELLAALLGRDPALEPLKRLLIERTEGNPFFLEESVRTLVETGALVGEPGAYGVARPLPTIRVPPTVQAVLAARIDRLLPEDKQLLQSAAVIGKEIPFPLLQAVAGLAEDILRRGLASLLAGGFLDETSLLSERGYTFRHALTHEVAYGSLLQEQRSELHRRIVEAVERHYADRLSEHIERLAHHALRGELWPEAVTYLREAGIKAAARAAHRDAAGCFEQALSVVRRLPETRETMEQAIDLLFDVRSSLNWLGELERVLVHLREAERLSGALGDLHRLARAFAYLSDFFWVKGDQDRAIEFGQKALAMATNLGDAESAERANFFLGLAYHACGDYRQAIDHLTRCVDALEVGPVRRRTGWPGYVEDLVWLGWCLAERGEFAEAIARAREALRLAEAAQLPARQMAACFGIGVVRLWRGELSEAVPVLERGLELTRRWEIPVWLAPIAWCLGSAQALTGRVAEALPLLEQAVREDASRRIMVWHSLMVGALGEGHLLAGRLGDASHSAARALEFARRHQERGHEAWALRLLGEIASHHDPPDVATAEAHYGAAMALASGLGMRPLVAHCHLGLGKLYRRISKRQEAQEHLITATTMYREMGMTYWLDRTEKEMTELG
ncbi:MAG: AAA family ATPase [Candidatus Rokuibacteriota bacterium]